MKKITKNNNEERERKVFNRNYIEIESESTSNLVYGEHEDVAYYNGGIEPGDYSDCYGYFGELEGSPSELLF